MMSTTIQTRLSASALLFLLVIATILPHCVSTGITTTTLVVHVTAPSSSLRTRSSSHHTSTIAPSSKARHTSTDFYTSSTSAGITTSSQYISSGICTYRVAPGASCIPNPPKAVSNSNQRTTIVGAALGAILGLVVVGELAGMIVLRTKLTRANRIVSEQSAVLWRIRGREVS